MSEQDLTVVDAIQMALESEKKAAATYGDAAENAPHVALERLFNGLAGLEQHHYDKVAELAASLQKKGKYIVYEASSISIPAQSEIEIAGVAGDILGGKKVSMMDVLTMAQNVEQQLDKWYSALAEKTSDRDGKAMFEWLAKEERSHLDLLTTVYWNLNDRGVLAWPGI
ncbi:MAG TPA: ferritin family protein [Anaerolineae bacterium]|nr:ferritin family protein [Anaerolineae bacterium]